jgi:hypothetical protein
MITSQITGKPVYGTNPVGFSPIVPLNNGGDGFFMTQNKNLRYDVALITLDPLGQVPTNKQLLLDFVKADLDANYLPTILTDPAINYEVEITVNSITHDFEPTIPGVTDRSIYTERTYYYYFKVSMRINVV